ncbi:hypothetical protein Tco_0309178 [Tanacetum coccineum]
MGIEQYLTHNDYTLWEIIVNGNASATTTASASGVDAKSLWEAINTRFGGNKESKKMQKAVLNQLEIHGEVISIEDINLKLLRSLPSAWNTHSLVIRNKGVLDTVTTDDLYNNLNVNEVEIKGQSSSSSNS